MLNMDGSKQGVGHSQSPLLPLFITCWAAVISDSVVN